jgi:hypothetical protein
MPRGVNPLDAARLQGRLWTPREAGGALRFWMQADALATLTIDGSDGVSEWRDIAGSGRNWAQATAGSRPFFRPAGWDGVRPSLDTNGASSRHVRMTITAIAQPFIVALVARRVTMGANAHWTDSPTSRIIVGGRDGGGNTIAFAGASITGPATDTLPHVHAVIFNGSSSTNFVDGAVVSTGNAGGNSWSDQWLMWQANGGSWPSDGHVFGVCLIASASRAMADRLSGYMAWAAGIQSRLAASHPFRNAPPLIGG